MHNILSNVKNCKNCGAMIEAREMTCKHCNHVFEAIKLTPEEKATSYAQICEDINNAFFRLEGFMYGNATSYQSFDFDRAFSVLFFKTREAINYTPKNFKLISKYWDLTQQISYDHDKTNYSNHGINDNKYFLKDVDVIYHLNNNRLHEFNEFTHPDEWEEKRLSILDIQRDLLVDKDDIKSKTPKSKTKKMKSKKKEEEHIKLIRDLELVFTYNYPALEKPLQFYGIAKESVRKFKYLVPIKIKSLPSSEIKFTLKHYDDVLNALLENAHTNFNVIEKWLVKYKIQYHTVLHNHTNNELVKFLYEKLPSLRYSLSPEYNKDQEHIQYDFFNYWYGLFLLEASTSVQELREVIDPSNVSSGFQSETINEKSMAVKEVSYEILFPKIPKPPIASVTKQNPEVARPINNGNKNDGFEEKKVDEQEARELRIRNGINAMKNALSFNLDIPLKKNDPNSSHLNKTPSLKTVGKSLLSNAVIEADEIPLDNANKEMKAIVEDFMEQFSEEEILSDSDYEKTLKLFTAFFLGQSYESGKCIVLKQRVNKRFALECCRLFREACPSKAISYEYLIFLKKCFLPFENEIIEKEKFQKSRLYKYLTAKK
ncbi:MAG: hypothetical protein KJ712_01445 [Bacteroidetes bacterium]|nr:hypothetical protein [Bacteroidota bacterium]MBU1485838.1 hypothetical protein [Bacteroidota bacterium]MBU2045377.1 hypothetical protein [Bacteroidota bacterium]MBU2268147.1 hypothetical protein [Bacteroidota bacterium]